MDHRTGCPPQRRDGYNAPRPSAPRRIRQMPPAQTPPLPAGSGSPRRRVRPQGASYRRYAMRQRIGVFFRRVCYLLSVGLIAAAAFLFLNSSGLISDGSRAGPAQPAAAPGPSPTPDARFVVAVDPGHGGGDPGTEGVSFTEEEMTWDTAGRLMQLLEADGRFRAFLTTDGGEYEKPSQRAANARAGGAQLLLSIHGNSGDDPGYAGFECYAVPPGRTYNAESLAFGEMIASRFGDAGERLRGENGVRYIYYDANNEKQIFEVSDTAVHSDPSFTLLEECGCPAVLAEQCFITSPADVDAFGDEDGRQAAAQIYYEAICEWYETYAQSAAAPTPDASSALP